MATFGYNQLAYNIYANNVAVTLPDSGEDFTLVSILQNDAGEGASPVSRVEGEASLAREGAIVYSFKDAAGNVSLPQLTADNKLQVDTEASELQFFYDEGELIAPTVGVEVDLAIADLPVPGLLESVTFQVASRRGLSYAVVYVEDALGSPVETELAKGMLGPAEYSKCSSFSCRGIDASLGAGVLQVVLRVTPLFVTSDVSGMVSACIAT